MNFSTLFPMKAPMKHRYSGEFFKDDPNEGSNDATMNFPPTKLEIPMKNSSHRPMKHRYSGDFSTNKAGNSSEGFIGIVFEKFTAISVFHKTVHWKIHWNLH
jgi:hypothetical protein